MNYSKLMVVLTTVVSMALPTAVAAEAFVYTNVSPDTHYDNTYVMKRFSDTISEGTGGAHSLAITGGGVLASGGATMDAIANGIVDMGNVVYAYSPSVAPALTFIGDLPGAKLQISAAAATATILLDCPECEQNQKDLGIKVLGENSTESYSLICTKSPVTTLAEANGIKVRGIGAIARNAKSLGMTPVNVTYPEIYEAMQRGQVDCTAIGAASFASIQLYDVAKYVTTDFPMGTTHGYSLLTLNRDVWDSFTGEQKGVWHTAARNAIVDNSIVTLRNSADALKVSEMEKGIKMVAASAELKDAYAKAMTQQTQDAINTAKERGVKTADAIAAAYGKNVEKWTAIFNDIGSDGKWDDAQWDKYAALLKSEIYDKLSVE